jgi:WD40 repeat protein
MDFHLALQNIITVSMDGTIRLWDLKNFEQVIEFNSPLEMPLCVAAHPTLPLFSCGFQTGTMRVFDIEKTCVASDFTQFNKAIRSLAYS